MADLKRLYGGWTAIPLRRAGELLLGVGIPVEQHYGPMSEVAPLEAAPMLLAQALFSNPTFCCSTNRRTTWTSAPSAGWSRRSTTAITP